MGKLRNFVTPLHQATKRDYLARMVDDKVLLVDGLNLFIRCWNANPMMNEDGLHFYR